MIDIDQVIRKKEQLNKELQLALATLEKKDDVKEIREKIHENQECCPHYSNKYNFVWEGNKCPYCGKCPCISRWGN